MEPVDLIGLAVPVTYFLFLITEKLWPARVFPARKGWQWIGVGFLLLIGTVSSVVPLLIPEDWLASHRWLDGTTLGIAGGTIVGYFAMSAVAYAWHRAAHNVGFLWRGFHQIHHSPQRVDIPGSVLFHPLEMIMMALLQLVVTVIVLGLDPIAAALVGYVAAFYGMFQHWNVRTPQWLGYIIQRPESHCVHHRKGVHYYNYADFPLWDMLSGTFRNPRNYIGDVGFETPGDKKLGAMLLFADVNAPLYGPGSLGATLEVTSSRRAVSTNRPRSSPSAPSSPVPPPESTRESARPAVE